jgi:hypothetical protein
MYIVIRYEQELILIFLYATKGIPNGFPVQDYVTHARGM